MIAIKRYIRFTYELTECLGIDTEDFKDEVINTSTRMTTKYIENYIESESYEYLFEELFDSLVDILYYLGDYIFTKEYNEFDHNNKNYTDKFQSEYIEDSYPEIRQFSHKACEDYQYFTDSDRIINRNHISKMIMSEITEFISIYNMFSMRNVYTRNGKFNRKNIVDLFDQYESDEDLGLNTLDECLEYILNLSIIDDTKFSDVIKPLFNIVHTKNMLKVFRDDRFHFDGKKVIKPDWWQEEVNNNPDLFDPHCNKVFSNYIDRIYDQFMKDITE